MGTYSLFEFFRFALTGKEEIDSLLETEALMSDALYTIQTRITLKKTRIWQQCLTKNKPENT